MVTLAAAAALMPGTICHAQDAPPPPPPPPEASSAPAQPADTTPATPAPAAPGADTTGTANGAPPPPPEAAGTPAATTPAAPSPAPAGSGETPPTSSAPSSGHYLLLPDISFIGTFLGHLSTDRRDSTRDRLRFDSGEIGIQSYVYPGIKADAFFVAADGGGSSFEEAYLTVQNFSVAKVPLSAEVGRRKVPFGRVNQQHQHSWNYIVQPYVLQNLVASESLVGDGGYVSYLLPTGKLFTQLDAGFWSASETPEEIDTSVDPAQTIVPTPGVGFADRFGTARLWTATDVGTNGTLEVGASTAWGKGERYTLSTDTPVHPNTQLLGFDVTYRRAEVGASRLLLRGEYVQHRQDDSGASFHRNADGFYVLADQRFGPYRSLGFRYDDSAYPFAPGREKGASLIATQALTEQTYIRFQLIHGDRPGKRNFNELWFEWVWGVGPHTHNLE